MYAWMCTCPCNWCHTLREAIPNIVKSNTLPLNNARNKFAHRILMCTYFPMGLINIHWYKNDTNTWIVFAYTRWMIFILRAFIHCLALVSGFFLYVLVAQRSLNAHFERKHFSGLSSKVQEPKYWIILRIY